MIKHLYIILFGFLFIIPITYANKNKNAENEKLIISQPVNITVKGKVVDETGLPLAGASIQQKGTTIGTVTDADGNFIISVPPDVILIVSYIGYSSKEIPVDGKTDLGTIILTPELKQLEQVVVIGYGTQLKADLTGSVAIVKIDEIQKVSNSNISTTLQGKVPGVLITTDGQPGADPSVRIRGIATFGSSSPLYIVDGVPVGNIRDFSPNDIESIQVLKDAAASIYGSRAANGVIIITTKQGKKNQPAKIDYKGYIGFDQVPRVYDVMDAYEYKKYVTMAFENSNMEVPGGYDPESEYYLFTVDGKAKVNTDWFEEAFKTGLRQNHNINVSGGGTFNTYNLSLDYYKQEGTMLGTGPNLDRYTVRLNNNFDIKFIKFKTGIVYSHSDQDNMARSNANEWVQGLYGAQFPVMASVLFLPPTIRAYDKSTWVLDDKIPAAVEYKYDSYGFGTYYDNIHGDIRITNVLLENNLTIRNFKVDRVMANGSANVDFMDMLNIKNSNHKLNYVLNLAYNKTNVRSFVFVPAFIQSTTNYLAKSNEFLLEENRQYTNMLVENTLTYDGTIGRNQINAVLGQTFEHDLYHLLSGRGNTFPEPYYLQLSNAADRISDSYENEHLIASFLGRLNYNFDQKYFISILGRYDGSSRLAPGNCWELFPSFSAGWRLDREKFFPIPSKIVNLFKIRGSYGVLGNENIGEYQYISGMRINDYTYSFGNVKVFGSSISNFVNTGIKWEKRKTTNIGFDVGMFNNKLELNFDWYKAISEDLLYNTPIPLEAGFTNSNVVMNAATMENSGLEFLVSYTNNFKSLKYNISANLTTIKNKVTKLGIKNDPRIDGICRTEVGKEIGQFYGYIADGIFQSQYEIDNYVNSKGLHVIQPGAQPGDIRYVDIDNDGKITDSDRTFLGSGLPDITYGLNIGIEWNGFDLTIITFGALGFKAVDYVDMALHSSYGALNKSVDLLNAWTPDNTNTNIPRVSYKTSGAITNDLFSQRFIQDADYLKIANIELGYNLQTKWLKNYIRSLRIYVSSQNVFTLTKYKGYNVDFAGGTFTPGYNYASYPTPRTIMFGVNLSF